MTVCPIFDDNLSANILAITSVSPPGGKDTTIVIGFSNLSAEFANIGNIIKNKINNFTSIY
jgi:hypothetical protein